MFTYLGDPTGAAYFFFHRPRYVELFLKLAAVVITRLHKQTSAWRWTITEVNIVHSSLAIMGKIIIFLLSKLDSTRTSRTNLMYMNLLLHKGQFD